MQCIEIAGCSLPLIFWGWMRFLTMYLHLVVNHRKTCFAHCWILWLQSFAENIWNISKWYCKSYMKHCEWKCAFFFFDFLLWTYGDAMSQFHIDMPSIYLLDPRRPYVERWLLPLSDVGRECACLPGSPWALPRHGVFTGPLFHQFLPQHLPDGPPVWGEVFGGDVPSGSPVRMQVSRFGSGEEGWGWRGRRLSLLLRHHSDLVSMYGGRKRRTSLDNLELTGLDTFSCRIVVNMQCKHQMQHMHTCNECQPDQKLP